MTTHKPVELTDANFEAEVLNSEQPVLVDFWAAWCGPCRLLAPTVEELANTYDGKAKVGKLDVDANPQTAAKFGISSIPSVLLFKDGQVVENLVGVQSQQRYEQLLDQQLVEA